MAVGKGFVTHTAFKKHLDGDWRTVHELWSHIRNYMISYPAPQDTTYTKTETDAFFEGYSGGKAQVDAGNVVGLTQGSIPFADASGFLTEANSAFFYDAGNIRLGVGTGSPQSTVHLLNAAATELRVETSGQADPFFCLKTTFTDGNGDIAHEVHFALDQSAAADHVDFIGQTAGVDTFFHVVGKAGQSAKMGVQIGAYRGEFICGSAGHVSLLNITEDKNLVFGINDGGVTKTITWNAANDKLQHSGGLFNFDDDNILTTGTLGCGAITVQNGSGINLQEDITFTGATTVNQIKFPDNLPDALSFLEGANPYMTFVTTNGSEAIHFHKPVGININNPGNLLDILSGASAVSINTSTGNNNWNELNICSGAADVIRLQLFAGNVDANPIKIGARTNTQVAFTVADSAKMIISTAGYIGVGLTPTANMAGLSIEQGCLTLKERATPTADANYGKIYTKNDNKLYCQTGDGVEHEVAFV